MGVIYNHEQERQRWGRMSTVTTQKEKSARVGNPVADSRLVYSQQVLPPRRPKLFFGAAEVCEKNLRYYHGL